MSLKYEHASEPLHISAFAFVQMFLVTMKGVTPSKVAAVQVDTVNFCLTLARPTGPVSSF